MPFEIYWEPGFAQSLARIGIAWETFDRLGRYAVDFLLQTDPLESKSTFDLGETNHRYLSTRFRFPDLPAMLIAFEVDEAAHSVTVNGAEPVWDSDLFDLRDAF